MVIDHKTYQSMLPEVENPEEGLADDVFDFVTPITPMVNVDLLVFDTSNKFLLTRRETDQFMSGWHVPGSIVRYKEDFQKRLEKLIKVEFCNMSISQLQMVCCYQIVLNKKRTRRGHFISFLYKGIAQKPASTRQLNTISGKWFDQSPEDLIPVHEIYRNFMDGNSPINALNATFGDAKLLFCNASCL